MNSPATRCLHQLYANANTLAPLLNQLAEVCQPNDTIVLLADTAYCYMQLLTAQSISSIELTIYALMADIGDVEDQIKHSLVQHNIILISDDEWLALLKNHHNNCLWQ